jgi:hypothetical protein
MKSGEANKEGLANDRIENNEIENKKEIIAVSLRINNKEL